MAVENITDSFLRSQNWLERMGGNPQIDLWDQRRGLVMRVTAGADEKVTLSWCLVYKFDSHKRRLTLGRWPDMRHEAARAKADKMRGKIANGVDPVAEQRARREHRREIENVVTVHDAAIRFLNEYRTKKREKWRESTEHTNRLMVANEVLPVLGSWPVTAITSDQIESLLQGIIKRGKGKRGNGVRANRVQALLSGLFKFAMKTKMVHANPVSAIERLGAERPRERRLSHAEIKKLWHALGDGDAADQYRFMLATGQRVGECAKVEWREIADGWWTIPSEKSKNHLSHRVYLGPLAMEILTRRGLQSTGYVFPHAAAHRSIPTWRHDRIKNACRFEEPWQPRDLRRTVASEVSPEFGRSIVAQLLNHSDSSAPRVTGVYDRGDQDPAKKKAMVWWNERLAGIVATNVIEMRAVTAA